MILQMTLNSPWEPRLTRVIWKVKTINFHHTHSLRSSIDAIVFAINLEFAIAQNHLVKKGYVKCALCNELGQNLHVNAVLHRQAALHLKKLEHFLRKRCAYQSRVFLHAAARKTLKKIKHHVACHHDIRLGV